MTVSRVLVVSTAMALSSPARADSRTVEIIAEKSNNCPSDATVATALAPLLPLLRITTVAGSADAIRAIVTDLGSRYRVAIFGSEREFTDAPRACDERAHAVAVFLAVMIDPTSLSETAPAPPGPIPPPEKPAPLLPAPRWEIRPVKKSHAIKSSLELGAIVSGAPRSGADNSLVAGGASVRAFVGGKYLGAALGISALSQVTMQIGAARGEMTRAPIDLDLRATFRHQRLELFGDLGAVMAILYLKGLGDNGGRLEFGIRAALGLRVWVVSRLALFAALDTEIFPKPQRFETDPIGTNGNTPYVWVGGANSLKLSAPASLLYNVEAVADAKVDSSTEQGPADEVDSQVLVFEQIYNRWVTHVARWAKALGTPASDLEDMTQEIFIIVQRSLLRFDGANVSAWLYRITSHAVRDYRRKAWFRNLFLRPRDVVIEDIVESRSDAAGLYQRKQMERRLEELLAKLSEKRRTTFILFEIEGYSGEEIATLHDVPLKTVWTRLHHARKELSDSIAKLEAKEPK